MDTIDIPDRMDLRTLLLSIMILIAAYFRQKIIKPSPNFPRVNGVLASKAQIELAKRLSINNVNYKVGGSYIDIAIPRKKIAIEYNGYYWHKGKEVRDRQRAQRLIDKGWKVLVLVSKKNTIPSASFVRDKIKRLSNQKPYLEVLLD